MELTVAVNVTACPKVEGFSEDEIVVVVEVSAHRLEAVASRSVNKLAICFIEPDLPYETQNRPRVFDLGRRTSQTGRWN